jgi:hypothetical protein
VDDADLRTRNSTYRLFVKLGRAPRPDEVAAADDVAPADVRASWRRLHEAHALVLDGAGDILMANPFSAVPTRHRVDAGGKEWFANCAWDAVGVCAALGADGDIASSCPHCGEPIEVGIRDHEPTDTTLLFHCLVTAASWWDDIAFT